MQYSRGADNLGVKLTPKLIQAVSQSVIATKRGLLDTEHKLRVGAAQAIIDRAGMEYADLHRPILTALLESGTIPIDPMAREFLERTSSGEHQWEAIAGITGGAATGAISTVLNNFLADPVRNLVSRLPSLSPDVGTVANLFARGWLDRNDAYYNSRGQGYSDNWFDLMYRLAQSWPNTVTLFEMYHRGVITWSDVELYLERNGIDSTLWEHYFKINNVLPTVADAALGILRNDITSAQGYELARANGMTDADFDLLILNTGEPPGIMQLLEAYRREFIDENTLHRGVLQSRIRDEWWPTIFALRYEPLSTADAIQSSVQGYITKDKAKEYATQNGLNPDDFDAAWLAAGEPLSRTEMTYLVNWGFATMDDYKNALRQSRLKDSYIDLAENLIKRPMSVADAVEGFVQNYLTEKQADDIMGMNGLRDQDKVILREIAGEPVSKTEALTLLRRGEMTLDQVKQALRESRLKDKYIDQVIELQTNYPGIYDIRLLVSEGAIDDTQAAKLLAIEGYPADLIKPLIAAFSGASSTASKAVTEAMLADLFLESAINATEFTEMLQALGYSPANAALILEVNQWKAELTARNSLLARVRTLYVGNKITAQQAENDLTVALVPYAVVTKVMADWELERTATVKLLSEAQIVDAWNSSLFSDNDPPVNTSMAVAYLAKLGYSPDDADILLELKNKPLFDGSPSGNASKGKKNTTGQTGS
jgi:hypothetical protein